MSRLVNPYVLILGIAFITLGALDPGRPGWLAIAAGAILFGAAWRT